MLASAPGGGSSAVGPASGGKTYAFNNISTVPLVVAPANPQRTQLSWYNPGLVNIYIAPVNVQAVGNVNAIGNLPLSPSLAALGGTFIIYANGGSFTITGECQGAYQAFAAAGSTNPLTVLDSNV